MMKTVINLAAVLMALLLFAGCNGDNDYDGENGLVSGSSGSSTTQILRALYTEVIVSDSNTALALALDADAAIAALMANQSADALATAQTRATALFGAWKRVEALYVAKKYDDALIDIPAQIDYFNQGNTDIPARLDTIFAGTSSLQGQLFQSATRSMTALEYTLFGHQEGADVNMTQRRAEAAGIMIDYLRGHLQTIAVYYAGSDAFATTGEDSVGILINQLIDSAYKLKEWRLGDPAGFTVKYKDDPDATRFEYYKSEDSLDGIRAILAAQRSALTQGLQSIAAANAASGEAEALIVLLDDALAQVDAFGAPVEADPDASAVRSLYNTVNAIQAGYTALINALNFQQDIIEADGD